MQIVAMKVKPAKTASITVRGLDERVKHKLRLRAATRGRSLEAEVRDILSRAAKDKELESSQNLAEAIAAIVDPVGGVELDLPHRVPMREPPRFQDWDEEDGE
jgi:plasmid stability protein